MFFSLRCIFDYPLRRGERRFVTLHAGPQPEHAPDDYRIELEGEDAVIDARPIETGRLQS